MKQHTVCNLETKSLKAYCGFSLEDTGFGDGLVSLGDNRGEGLQ